EDPVAARRAARVEALAVVRDLEDERAVVAREADPYAARARVPCDVRQRFLQASEDRGRSVRRRDELARRDRPLAHHPGALREAPEVPIVRRTEAEVVEDP